jgi:N-glycosylase/DNA lyase
MHITNACNARLENSQIVFDATDEGTVCMELPPASADVIPGLCWGLAESPFTPAFWAVQVWLERNLSFNYGFRWGPTLKDEIVGCLLGGHGITWEMNRAAFLRLKEAGLLSGSKVRSSEIIRLLLEPFETERRRWRYRFPRQRGVFVSEAVKRIEMERPPIELPLVFREWLLGFRGIGMKTASWITRNFLEYRRVAVLDVHVFRAGVLMGLFSGRQNLAREYQLLESRYLSFADAINADPRLLDAVIWKTMRNAKGFAIGRLIKR